MFSKLPRLLAVTLVAAVVGSVPAMAQLGHRFPSEKKVVIDPITGTPLTFVTSTPAGDSKIYPTHPQWTADNKWVIFTGNFDTPTPQNQRRLADLAGRGRNC